MALNAWNKQHEKVKLIIAGRLKPWKDGIYNKNNEKILKT